MNFIRTPLLHTAQAKSAFDACKLKLWNIAKENTTNMKRARWQFMLARVAAHGTQKHQQEHKLHAEHLWR
jgi:hypothetical protein